MSSVVRNYDGKQALPGQHGFHVLNAEDVGVSEIVVVGRGPRQDLSPSESD